MLTNTLLLYMTQEALTKARQRLKARKGEADDERGNHVAGARLPHWRTVRQPADKRSGALRH